MFASSGIAYVARAARDVLFTVDTIVAQLLSGGIVDCIPTEQTSSKDINKQPLRVTQGAAANVASIRYSGCS
jgi:hypothetical protein